MIRWDPAGEYIIVERPEQLALHVLPSIYRQSRFASFSRQLNVGFFCSSMPQQTFLLRSMDSCARLICATSTLPLMIPTPVPGVCPRPFSLSLFLLLTLPPSPPHTQPPLPPRGRCQFQAPRASSSTQTSQARHPRATHNPPSTPRSQHEFCSSYCSRSVLSKSECSRQGAWLLRPWLFRGPESKQCRRLESKLPPICPSPSYCAL